MSASTLLLYTKATGHVLAAATVAAPPSGDIKPEALAGDLLPVRDVGDPNAPYFATSQATIPSAELAVLSMDAKAAPVDHARMFVIQNNEPVPLNVGNNLTIVLNNVNREILDVLCTPLPPGKVTVWVRVESADPKGPADPAVPAQLVSQEVTNVTGAVHVPLQKLDPGHYWVLVLVTGYIPFLTTIS
jgi:hypothetical protein